MITPRPMTLGERRAALREYPRIAPGVHGELVWRGRDTVFINVVVAAVEGSGDVGRWLDSLSGFRVIVPLVASPRLKGMLERRGYVYEGYGWTRDGRVLKDD